MSDVADQLTHALPDLIKEAVQQAVLRRHWVVPRTSRANAERSGR
ncbi:hypothetical protein [Mycobacterium sp. 852002-51057_SCH5723018]|nr:hypothetical protein [Mycobacterium sp. 852002-51057_SCH5723018]